MTKAKTSVKAKKKTSIKGKSRTKTPSFTHEFRLSVTKAQARQLNIRFEGLRQIYNAVIGFIKKQDKKLKTDEQYQYWIEQYRIAKDSKDETVRKRAGHELKTLSVHYQLTKNDVEQFAKHSKNHCYLKDHIDAVTCQVIAARAFSTYEDSIYKGKGKPRFKSWKNALRSISGKQNVSLRFKDGHLIWKTPLKTRVDIRLPIKFSKTDKHGVEAHALNSEVKYCRLVRREMKGKFKFYLQMVLKGEPKVKKTHQQKFKQAKGQRGGLDIGPGTIAAVAEDKAFLRPFVQELKDLRNEIKAVQRRMSRSLRLKNPDNYVSHQKKKGEKHITVWKVKKGARQWLRSRNYEQDLAHLKELHRQMRDKRQYLHNKLSLDVLFMASDIYTEKLSYKAFQKLYGRSVGFRAPGQFIETLKRKASKAGATVHELNTQKAKLSQYNHHTDTYTKKPLSQRFEVVSGEVFQRDLYSAFLASCYDKKHQATSRSLAKKSWDQIRPILHNALLETEQMMRGQPQLSSLGIKQVASFNAESESFALETC